MNEDDIRREMKEPLVARSETPAVVEESTTAVYSLFPKRYEIVVDVHPDNPQRIIMRRKSENLLGFELLGLLELVIEDVRHQLTLRQTTRSDGAVVPDQPHIQDEGVKE